VGSGKLIVKKKNKKNGVNRFFIFLMISDFVGGLYCEFYQCPERAKYPSVGQRPTKIDFNDFAPTGQSYQDQIDLLLLLLGRCPERCL
jgi:hypothetical protein